MDGVDELSELAFEFTPYRYAFNNPVNYIDEFGLFESRAEAREYKRENELRGTIRKDADGTYSINNKKESTSIFKDEKGEVQTAALVTPETTNNANIAIPIFLGETGSAVGSGIGLGVGAIVLHFVVGLDRIDRGLPVYDIPTASYPYMRSNPGLSPGFPINDFSFMKSSGKNERHGDGGRAMSKAEKQIEDLKAQMKNANQKEKRELRKKIENVTRNASKKQKGEEHSRANKR